MSIKSLWRSFTDLFKLGSTEVISLQCKHPQCPAIYEGKLEDGRMIYVRYRWGYFSIRVSDTATNNANEAMTGEEVYGEAIGGDFDGAMDESEVLDYLKKAGFEYVDNKIH